MESSRIQPERLQALFQGGKQFNYRKNETILRAREAPRGIYYVEDGTIKIYSFSKQGNEHVLDFLGRGDLFPIIWPFRHRVRSMYYEATSKVTLKMIPRETFRNFLDEHPDAMSDLLEKLVDRYYLYVGRIDNLLYSDALERSAYRLLSLAHRFGVKTKDGLMIDAVITHEDLAHSISTTRETFGRSMSRLQRSGIVGYDTGRHIVITDMPGLVRIIGHDEVEA
ncbi:MAG: Crp/Fnr family transcriptional regulator, partial [Candidatus Saccharimonadales bacterium]